MDTSNEIKLPLTEAGGMDLAQGANWYANRVIERMTHQPRPGDVRAEIRDILQEAYIAGARRQQQSKDDSDENAHLCGMCKHWYSGVACPDCVPDETEQAFHLVGNDRTLLLEALAHFVAYQTSPSKVTQIFNLAGRVEQ